MRLLICLIFLLYSQLFETKPDMKKLLYIITQGHWGGAQRYVYDLATGLRQDYDIAIALGRNHDAKNFIAKLKAETLPVIILPHLARAIRPVNDLLVVWEIRKLIISKRPDIIHLNSSKAGVVAGFAILTLPKRQRPKVVYTAHGWVFDEPLPWVTRTLYLVLERLTARFKDAIIVLGKRDADTATNRVHVKQERLSIIPIGIRPTLPANNRASYRQSILATTPRSYPHLSASTLFWIGAIANFYRTKGLDVLIAAAATVCQTKPDTVFIIIGDGPERPQLETLIQKNNLGDRIILLGFLPEAAALLPAFDLFVLPSRKEGLPYTILEAATLGVPIIATSVGAIPEIITDKKNGLLVPPENSLRLAAAILYAQAHESEMKTMASVAKNSSAECSLENMLTKTAAVYQSLLAAKSH